MTAQEIYLEGGKSGKGYSNTRFDRLVDASINGQFICYSGMGWINFDYEYGQEKLLEKDVKGNFILLAGIRWKEFNYDTAITRLEELNPDGYWLYRARLSWNLNEQQIQNILDKDTGHWAYVEYKTKRITKEEAFARDISIKWKRKIEKLRI